MNTYRWNRTLALSMAAAVVLLPYAHHAIADQPPPQWATLQGEHYQLYYAPQLDKDAQKIKADLDAGIAALKKEFAEFPVAELLDVDCKVYLHPTSSDVASESAVNITTGVRDDKYFAVIDLLSPSAYDPNYRSNIGAPAGDDYFAKLVVHEYSTILLDRISRSKKTGAGFFNSPPWFINGFEEYLGLNLSTPHNRDITFGKYLDMLKADPSRINVDFGLTAADEYIDGSILLTFMHDTYGPHRVHAILTSPQPTFGKAITTSLGVDLPEFHQKFVEWMKSKAGVPTTQP